VGRGWGEGRPLEFYEMIQNAKKMKWGELGRN